MSSSRSALYDTIGAGYCAARVADARIAALMYPLHEAAAFRV